MTFEVHVLFFLSHHGQVMCCAFSFVHYVVVLGPRVLKAITCILSAFSVNRQKTVKAERNVSVTRAKHSVTVTVRLGCSAGSLTTVCP